MSRAVPRRLLLVAAAALIDVDGRVLITQRPQHKAFGGLWEFLAVRSSWAKRPNWRWCGS